MDSTIPLAATSSPSSPPPGHQAPITRVFVGRDGVRAGWRLMLYVFMAYVLGRLLILATAHVAFLKQINGPPTRLQVGPQ